MLETSFNLRLGKHSSRTPQPGYIFDIPAQVIRDWTHYLSSGWVIYWFFFSRFKGGFEIVQS